MRGVVIGKFLPPHAGHHFLIRTALDGCDEVDVLVCHRAGQPIPGAQRAAWLAEVHATARVTVVCDDIEPTGDERETAAWAHRTVEVLGVAPDVVYTSEAYGDRYAELMGARHVSVDPSRSRFPVAGSAVLAEPAVYWKYLEAPVKAGLTRRIALIGAESTGKTTLATALATRLGVTWVPEYGRAYCWGRPPGRWASEEFVTIARRQLAAEDAAARVAGPMLVCDTDALTTAVWHERYLGRRCDAVMAMAGERGYALTVLCRDDIPWVQDGTRESRAHRRFMTRRLREELARSGRRWLEVGGPLASRVDAVLRALSRV